MQNFTPFPALAGGVLIGFSASLLLMGSGRIAGISSILGDLCFGERQGGAWRAWFLAGLLGGGALVEWLAPGSIQIASQPIWLLGAGGILVGAGTRLGGGCTSGHGVCGVSRLSKRSIFATLTFMAVGIATVALSRQLGWLGAAP